MDEYELRELLGNPSASSKHSLKFFYLGKVPGPYKGKIVNWDVSAYIEVTLKNGKVFSIDASHVTSY